MKDILESSEAFTAHATISAGYYMMQEAQKEFDKANPKSVIEKMVDESTGFAKERLKNNVDFLCVCLIDIIEAKKVIGADYGNDEKAIEQLQNLIK